MGHVVDFNRDRRMRCGRCGEEWTVDLAWVERWKLGDERCPGCDTTSEAEDAARFTAHPGDPALNDDMAAQCTWYHTSTHPDWPPTIDFAATLDDRTRRRMGSDAAVERWAYRQANKALHIGTYESAIHNMLRRMDDQSDRHSQFHLYRVHLKPEVTLHPAWVPDPSNLVGDVDLDEHVTPDTEALRYVNFHEDPGRMSVAIRPTALGSTERLAIPLPVDEDEPWIADTVANLSALPPDRRLPPGPMMFRHLLEESPRTTTAEAALEPLLAGLPVNLRDLFARVTRWRADDEPGHWATATFALAELLRNPARVLAAFDTPSP